jgi:hypothetical protein
LNFTSVRLLLVAGKSSQDQDVIVHVIGFQYDISKAQAAFSKPFQMQNRRSGPLMMERLLEQLK